MTPVTQGLLEALPMSRADFVARRGEKVLRDMCAVGGIKLVGEEVQITPMGMFHLQRQQLRLALPLPREEAMQRFGPDLVGRLFLAGELVVLDGVAQLTADVGRRRLREIEQQARRG